MNNIITTGLLKKNIQLFNYQKRSLWEWVIMMFNNPDKERIKEIGPDRACGEWLIKNGAAVRWKGEYSLLTNYHDMATGTVGKLLEDVHAVDCAIAHYGFAHFKGCKHIRKVVIHNGKYINDRAIPELRYLQESPVECLQISSCKGITDEGIMKMPKLDSLKSLVIYDLPNVKRMLLCEDHLKKLLPNCKIDTNLHE